MTTGDGNFDHLIKVCLPGFSKINFLFPPFPTLFFGSKSRGLPTIKRGGIKLCLLMRVEVAIHYLEFLKDVPGTLALMAEQSLYAFSSSSNASFLGFRFSFCKMRGSRRGIPWFAQLESPVLRLQFGQCPSQLERWVSNFSTCYQDGLG